MVIKPKVRGFICTTAHPVGAEREVRRQAEQARELRFPGEKPRAALVVGSSMGYGLSTRIAAAFGAGAGTVGVFLEKPASDKRTATAGWYNSAAFHRAAAEAGLYAASIDGDAFGEDVKRQAVETIRRDLGEVDLVVYSLAAPRRTLADGTVAKSVLKPIGQSYRNKTIDVESGRVSEVAIEPAEEGEVADTVKVMGGEDWEAWIDALEAGGALAPDVRTLAYSYIGPELTYAVYRKGSIGRAKDHLEATARRLDDRLRPRGGRAFVSVNKGLVTQSSSAIPVVPLYISLLFRVMKDKGLHEGTSEQMGRLLTERLYSGGEVPVDAEGRIRLDDLEMRDDVQAEVERRWREVSTDNVEQLSDLAGYRHDFLRLFGFGVEGVDYEADVDPNVPLMAPSTTNRLREGDPMATLDYALTIAVNQASTAAYYALTPTANLSIGQGGATLTPQSASATFVNVEPQMLEIQAPAGSVQGGVTITTVGPKIDGQVTVSPPVDVEVEVALYGAGGKQLGVFIVAAGVGGGFFEFEASAADAIPPGDVATVLNGLLPRSHT